MKNRILSVILVLILALSCAITSVAQSITLTTIVPDTLTLAVNVGDGGHIVFDQNEYSNEWQLIIKRGEEQAVRIVPNRGYRVSSVTLGNQELVDSVQNGQLALGTLFVNQALTISFEQETTTAVQSGVQTLIPNVAYVLPEESTWQVKGDPTTYQGGQLFYVTSEKQCELTVATEGKPNE